MATNRMTMKAAPATVFGVLADPTTYPDWLVGCKAIRSVDDGCRGGVRIAARARGVSAIRSAY